MPSVTQRIRQIQQPYGGYIRVRDLTKTKLDDQTELFPEENIHASLVGLTVDYLTRFSMGCPAEEAFAVSLTGAALILDHQNALQLVKNVQGLDDCSIISACKLSGYDVCARASVEMYKPVSEINPDANTIFNIRTMVERSVSFWKQYGPIVKSGFTFGGGYTETIDVGDGDYLTADTLWDFKVSKRGPTSQHTLQLLVYYIMGCHSVHPEFLTVTKLGIYNPRLNIVYTYCINQISHSVLHEVSEGVIGYQSGNSVESSSKQTVCEEKNTEPQDEWNMQDLVNRYGVSRSKITGDMFRLGMPHHKKGCAYYFIPDEVIVWEIQQRTVPYQKNGKIILPAYTEYGEYLKIKLKQAKLDNDTEEIQYIKQLMRENGYFAFNPLLWIVIIIGLLMFTCFLMLL